MAFADEVKRLSMEIATELSNPSDEFVRFILQKSSSGPVKQKTVDLFRPIVREILNELVSDAPVPPPEPAPRQIESTKDAALREPLSKLDGWTPLSHFTDVTHKAPPTRIMFPNGDVRPVGFWRDVMYEIAKWLNNTGRLSEKDLPVNGDGKGFSFVNSVPKSPNGTEFRGARKVSGRVFVETHYNANNLVIHCKKLLTHFSVDPKTVRLQLQMP